MTLEPLAGFQHFTTHHCVSGSLRDVFVYNGLDLSEEMLLGLGGGVGFSYWHFKGQPPFLGGRGGIRPPMEQVTAQRTGVRCEMHTTSSARKARQALLELLAAGQPVMIGCDMGFLPYFDFGGEYHFGGHAVVVCGYDAETDQVLIADRDEPLHPVRMADLERARGSTYQPFPPRNLWYTFDFAGKRLPEPGEVRQAIGDMCQQMLEPPISNVGVKGIHKAAAEVPRWPQKMGADDLRAALFNTYIFISPVGGSGGGNFRYMLSRFLDEAASLASEPCLRDSAGEFLAIADRWADVGEQFRVASEAQDPTSFLAEQGARLKSLAVLEEAGWRRLQELARQ